MKVISVRLNDVEHQKYLKVRPLMMSVKDFYNACINAYIVLSALEGVLGAKTLLSLKAILTGDVWVLKRFADNYDPYTTSPIVITIYSKLVMSRLEGDDLNYIYKVMLDKGVVIC